MKRTQKGKNIEIKSLGKTTLEEIYSAFIWAFSDYEVPIELPFGKFTEMLKTRDVNLDYSIRVIEVTSMCQEKLGKVSL